MEIESIEVIPMSKESKWEDLPRIFEVSMITTDYVTWFTRMYDDIFSYNIDSNIINPKLDESCLSFAKKQQAFMLAPTASFGSIIYAVNSKMVDTLDNIVINGPLYRVNYKMVDDMSTEKTVERTYVDPVTFRTKHGPWYSQKKVYKVRYGSVINV